MRAITCEAFPSYCEHVPQRIFAMCNLICKFSLGALFKLQRLRAD